MKTAQIASLLLLLTLNACSALTGALKAGPLENTEFVSHALAGQETVSLPAKGNPFHRSWRTVTANVPHGQRTQVWVAPIDVTEVLKAYARKNLPPISSDLAEVSKYLRERVQSELFGRGFEVVDEVPEDGLVVQLALVELSSTDIARNFLGTVLGAFVPGGSLLSIRSSGSTGIEGVVRDARSDTALFIFADRERGKTTLFSVNDYMRFAHARAAIDDWAAQLAQYLTLPEGSLIPDSDAIAFLQL